MNPDIKAYNAAQIPVDQATCDLLANSIDKHLKGSTKAVVVENKIWHRQWDYKNLIKRKGRLVRIA